jgi:hypothetical protein
MAVSRENVVGCRLGPMRRALSGLAPTTSTVLRIPPRRTHLRRAVGPGDLCQPNGLMARTRPEAGPIGGRRTSA